MIRTTPLTVHQDRVEVQIDVDAIVQNDSLARLGAGEETSDTVDGF